MGSDAVGGGSFRWFRDALGLEERNVARLTDVDTYEILTAEAAQAPAGCEVAVSALSHRRAHALC